MARKTTESAQSNKNSKGSNARVPLKDAQSNKRGVRNVASGRGARNVVAEETVEIPTEPRIFDDRTKRDIAGVVFGVVAVVLFVMVVITPSGIVTSFMSDFLHNLLGIGAYVMPVLLMTIGITLLVRTDRQYIALRISVGSFMVFIALLACCALLTPGVSADAMLLFDMTYVPMYGGWVGAGLAWLLLRLFGMAVSCVILAGIALGGAVIIGFSISGLIEKARDKTHEIRERHHEKEEQETLFDTPSYEDALPGPAIKRSPTPKVPRDLSKPRRASIPLSSQGLTHKIDVTNSGGEDIVGGPSTTDPDTYWPGEYAYDDTIDVPISDDDVPQKAMTRKLKRHKLDESDMLNADAPAANQKTRKLKNNEVKYSVPKNAKGLIKDGFALPPLEYLKTTSHTAKSRTTEKDLRTRAALLQETLADFSIMAQVVGWVAGPTVTLFKVDLPSGVRVSRIIALEDDIALALASPGVRIFAPIPGTNYVGIEVPNEQRDNVLLGDVIKYAHGAPLEMAIGKDVEGNAIITDLAKMPHLLIGGTTGSGKSVAINSMIMSILMRSTPDEVRLIMIDPKRVEFTPYNGIPHLYVPVVTENKEAASALAWGVAEMEHRLKILSKAGVRNINQYNKKVAAGEIASEEENCEQPIKKMPYIVIVIDELADLMMNVGKEVEFSISRIAQLARAAGIHLIVATQRPSTNVVTGLIKANITNRIAFNVASGIDSRVILDTPGAENLIGLGDMLFSKPEYAKPQRVQGCFVSEEEIEQVVEYLKSQGEPEYHQEILKTNLITIGNTQPDGSGGTATASDDPLLWEAADIVVSSGMGSTSNIQRKLSVGYSRAGRIMDMLEEKGIVGPPNGSKPREVLVDSLELETIKAFEAHDESDDSCPF